MKTKNVVMIAAVVLLGTVLAALILRMEKAPMGDDSHESAGSQPARGEAVKGPHGGRLLSEEGFQVEVTIYEKGVPPQFRLYAFEQGKPVPPEDVRLTIELQRFGGRIDVIGFKKEADYLLGDKVVEEPHSFDVTVAAEWRGKAYRWTYSQIDGRTELTPEVIRSSQIVIETAGPVRMKSIIELPGEVALNADKVVHVVPRLAGVVTEVRKNLGDRVSKGELLAVIDSRELADAKHEYVESVHRLELARTLFDREESLWKKKITSEEDYLVKRHAVEEGQITHQTARQKLMTLGLAKSDIDAVANHAEQNLSRYELKAPSDGVVVEKHLTLGEAVKEDAGIYLIADLSSVWVEVTVYAKDLNAIRVGQRVTIKSEALAAEAAGQLTYLGPLVGEQTRAAKARVVIPNPKGTWRPGLFVTAQVVEKEATVPLAVKGEALQTFRDWDVVFINAGNQFEVRPLKLGRREGEWVEVLSGLSPGEKYVSQNSFVLKADVEKSGASHEH